MYYHVSAVCTYINMVREF